MEYVALALQYKPLNLGQGFPDYFAPKNVTDALAATANSNNPLLQQYTRGFVSIYDMYLITHDVVLQQYNNNIMYLFTQ